MSRTTKVDSEDPKEVLDRLAPRGQQQEWTNVDGITINFGDGSTVQILERLVTQTVVERHNVELAAERETRRYWHEQWVERGAQLAAERQRREQAEQKFQKGKEWNKVAELELKNSLSLYSELMDDFKKVSDQLLSALAAIEKHNAAVDEWKACSSSPDNRAFLAPTNKIDIDLSALHEHDAKVRSKADKDWREQVAELITEHEQELAEVREPLVSLLCKIRLFLNRYRNGVVEHAEANSFASRIDDALVKVKGNKAHFR